MHSSIYYDAWNLACKKPFGAVPENIEMTISFEVNISLHPQGLSLVLRRDGSEESKRLFFSQKIADNHSITYQTTFSVEKEGLYFYRFEIETGEGILFVGKGEGATAAIGDFLPEWQLTVYQQDFETPSWPQNGLMYQIFPDRFYRSEKSPLRPSKNQRFLHSDWYERPLFMQDTPEYNATDFFGGNLIGITEKLPYLKSLGVTMLYLNPIFEAAANHRYNTGDYLHVDPYLGTDADFEELCQKAEELDIAVILDGVFSHTGSDSIYFNKERHYDSVGAFQSEESPYAEWYHFSTDRSTYESWWGFPTLPNVTETNPSYLQFVCGADGVLAHWMKRGVKGWRLDVADELPDAFLSALRHRIKQENPNAYLVGEVWEDASNKSSYEIRRPYLLGEQLDSVMNYPWRTAILHYVKMGKAEDFYNAVMTIADHYPLPAIKTLMTSVSTHDTVRAITYLGVEHPVSDEQKGNYALTAEESEKGKFLFQITAMIQYTLPGFPCLYYGDEVGVSGFSDPWNRRCYPWGREDFQLLSFFQQLGQTRQEYAESFAQDFQFVAVDQGMVAYVRGNRILTAINRGTTDAKLSLEGAKILLSLGNVLSEQHSILVSAESAAIILLHP